MAPRSPRSARRIRWYAIHRTIARLLLLWVVITVIITPRVPVPSTREPHRAILRVVTGASAAGALVGLALVFLERRRSVRKQYAISSAACLASVAVGLLGYPPHSGGVLPPRPPPPQAR